MKNALIVSVLALLPLGIHASAQSSAPTDLAVSTLYAVDAVQAPAQEPVPYYQTAIVERAQLQHMLADDLASILQIHFRGELRVHVEHYRNGVLLSGQPELVKAALGIAVKLDVAAPITE